MNIGKIIPASMQKYATESLSKYVETLREHDGNEEKKPSKIVIYTTKNAKGKVVTAISFITTNNDGSIKYLETMTGSKFARKNMLLGALLPQVAGVLKSMEVEEGDSPLITLENTYDENGKAENAWVVIGTMKGKEMQRMSMSELSGAKL